MVGYRHTDIDHRELRETPGVSDINEPNPARQDFKRQLTGMEWDYDFRRLFFTWTADISKGKFRPWVEMASREKTGGWIFPCDLYADANGLVHVLLTEAGDVRDENRLVELRPDGSLGPVIPVSLKQPVVDNLGKKARQHSVERVKALFQLRKRLALFKSGRSAVRSNYAVRLTSMS